MSEVTILHINDMLELSLHKDTNALMKERRATLEAEAEGVWH